MNLPDNCPRCNIPIGPPGPIFYGPEGPTPIAEIFICNNCGYSYAKGETVIDQLMTYENFTDNKGNPAGGHVDAEGLSIYWQEGPLGSPTDPDRREPNGAFVETVIRAAAQRIDYYQQSKFHCVENAIALGHLNAALEVLAERTRGRTVRGVEGTHTE